jgi:imidazolonepropionase
LKTKIINISKIYTWNVNLNILDEKRNHEILIEDQNIIEINNMIKTKCDLTIDADNNIITPGFIDSHTHPIFIGNRAEELQMRLNGKSYNEIKESGGGILTSIENLRNASFEELYISSINNITPFIKYGTTTLEAKSGYGLSLKDEIKSLRVIKKINDNLDIDILPTFLGAHAIPPEYNSNDYVDIICNEMLPQINNEQLAIFCDVFCEEGYFDINQSRKILNVAKSYNLIPRIHADEFKCFGASKLAKEIGAASADHLMHINQEGINALSSSNVIATLLPGTTFFLNKKEYANGRKLIDQNCQVSIASDFNPGTCTIRSLPNIMFLAMKNCGMTLDEVFLGVTYNAAKSLLKENELGLIKENYIADIIFWDVDSLSEIPYWFDSGYSKINRVIKRGKEIINN